MKLLQFVSCRVMIAIAIVRLHSVCTCSGCTWREGRHGDKDVDGESVDNVDVDNGLLRSETNKQKRVRL